MSYRLNKIEHITTVLRRTRHDDMHILRNIEEKLVTFAFLVHNKITTRHS